MDADFDAAVLGLALPAGVEAALREAALKRDDAAGAMAALMRARALAPDHPAVLIAFYRHHFFGHRLALDHPAAVKKIAVLDIVPTLKVFDDIDQRVATSYFHWFFLIQPFDFPERTIGYDPRYYLTSRLGRWGSNIDAFPKEVVEEYVRLFSDPACIHATCEDYRAAASIDLIHDQADRDLGRKVTCPMLALWAEKGLMHKKYDVVAVWRDYATKVSGKALPAGHFLPEEAPAETLAALREFLLG